MINKLMLLVARTTVQISYSFDHRDRQGLRMAKGSDGGGREGGDEGGATREEAIEDMRGMHLTAVYLAL